MMHNYMIPPYFNGKGGSIEINNYINKYDTTRVQTKMKELSIYLYTVRFITKSKTIILIFGYVGHI